VKLVILKRLRVPFLSALLLSNATVLNVSSVFAQTAQSKYETIIADARGGTFMRDQTIRHMRMSLYSSFRAIAAYLGYYNRQVIEKFDLKIS
jgi:hypothetical protein